MSLPVLSLVETRVLGVLVEKQKTVPDSYPLSLNALVGGCNQKTSRDPVIDVSESDVQAAVDHLRHLSLVIETSGGRVMRYGHNIARVLAIPSESVAMLATLMLRGPQTPGEIRINCERMHRFADTSSVENYLRELAAHPQRPLVAELPRAAGARETRWAHLLSGVPAVSAVPSPARAAGVDARNGDEIESLRREVESLAAELALVRRTLDRVVAEIQIKN